MKRLATVLCLVLGFAIAASAQTTTPVCTLTQITGQPQHKAILNWQASSAAGVGYNVYRCSNGAASCGAPFTGAIVNFSQVVNGGWSKIVGSINASQLSYTDTAVTAGSTYSYVVTAYDAAGVNWESGPTNVCSGTVPTGGGTSNGQTPPPGLLSGSVQ